MSNVLKQAAVVVQQKNLLLLNQYLQQLSLTKNVTNAAQDIGLDQILALALEALETGDFHQRWDVAKVFPQLGSVAIAPLMDILADEEEDRDLRWFAARILGDFQHPDAIAALIDVLKTSGHEDLIAMASTALARLGVPAITALTDLLAAEDTREMAVRSLAHIRRTETITPLLSVVNDPQVSIRATAIEALASFHDRRIPPVLIDALKDIAPSVRREAVIGLSLRTDLLEELDLVSQLKPLLWDFKLDVCLVAAIALGRMGTDKAAEVLFQVLQSPNTPIPLQLESVRAISWIETPKAIAYLQQALISRTQISTGEYPLSSSDLVCQEIIAVLGRVEQPDLVPIAAEILIDAFQSQHQAMQHTSLKQFLATSLGQLADPMAIETLIEMLAPDEAVRWHAIAALKKFPTAPQQLAQRLTDQNLTPAIQEGIAIALENLKF
jgi:HEAT repeat protein